MITIAIGGKLGDAVFKARVLEDREPRSVKLVLSPFCRPLVSFFREIKSVASVTVDEDAQSTFGHGEHVRWTVPVDINVEYPGYPNEWCPNYLARHFGGPITTVDEWFGAFSYILGDIKPFEQPTLYYDLAQSPLCEQTLERIRHRFPDLIIIEPDFRKNMLDNMRLAGACAERLCFFDGGMTLMSALGLSTIVDLGARSQGVNLVLFAVAEALLKHSEEIVDSLTQRLRCRYSKGACAFRIGRACNDDVWRLTMRKSVATKAITVVTAYTDGWEIGMGECSEKNKETYCRRHGYRFVCERVIPYPERPPAWNKIALVLRELSACDWLLWTDADSIVMNGWIRLEEFADDGFDLIIGEDANGINSGQFLVRNSPWSKSFFAEVWAKYTSDDHIWHEQAAMSQLLQERPEHQRHVMIVLNKLFNAYLHDGTYESGDFILHFPGQPERSRLLQEYARISNCFDPSVAPRNC